MSARRLRLEFAPRAERDLRSIWLYGSERWGEEQADSYLSDLLEGLDGLRSNPALGVGRDDLRLGVRSLLVGRHRAFYLVEDRQVIVLRVVHGRQDERRLDLE